MAPITEMNDELLNFIQTIGSSLVGRTITGAAYSERDGDPIIILNLIDENTTLTSWYMPLNLQAVGYKPGEEK